MGKVTFGRWPGIILVALLSTLLLAGVAMALSFLAIRLDTETRNREQQLVANGVAGWIDEVQAHVVGQTNWDDALKNLGVSFNLKWAQTNIGQFLHDMGGLERAYVLDAGDRPIYGMVNGADVAPANYENLAVQAGSLVAKIRDREARRPPLIGVAPFKTMLSKPIQASAINRVGGDPCIITATLVQPDFGTVTLQGRAPVVVTVEAMDKNFIASFGHRFLLQHLTIGQIGGQTGEDDAHHLLIGSNGQPIGAMQWQAQTPGKRLLRQALPPVVGGLLLFMAATIHLFVRARRAAQALIASESRLKFLAFHDHLTGLPNRAMLHDRLAHALRSLQRGGQSVGIFLIDLDRFKQVNDLYGHASGDSLIVEIASRLLGLVRANDTVTRLGGDEFAILITGASPRGMAMLAERIIAEMARPVELPIGRVFVGASVGMAVINEELPDDGEALRRADLAMYRAKEAGRGRYCFFEPEMDHMLKTRRGVEADLREALANNDLFMVYQPQVDSKGHTFGVEALARWNHPERGLISPAHFIPIAEECGLIEAVGTFALRQALTDSLLWPDLKVSVNVSAIQLRSRGFPSLIERLLKETRADPHRIELEITEGVLLNDDLDTHEALQTLRNMGLTIALDDFGTGYSSLSYLRKYPIDKVKIDKSFINNIANDPEAEAVVEAIVKLARALSLNVIAEGVESTEQRASLGRLGCPEIQGYLYSKPIAADKVAGFVRHAMVATR